MELKVLPENFSKFKLNKYPRTESGFYLPSLKIWNNFAEDMEGVRAELVGSIDDLVFDKSDGHCKQCNHELVRYAFNTSRNGLFRFGRIFCPNYSPEHPTKYWVEIWPDAYEQRKLSFSEEDWKNRLQLSDMLESDPGYAESGIKEEWKPIAKEELDLLNRRAELMFCLSNPLVKSCFVDNVWTHLARDIKRKITPNEKFSDKLVYRHP